MAEDMQVRCGLFGVVVLALTLTRSAHAFPTYPEAIQAAVPSLACVPQCILCHRTNDGGKPVDKPFALDLLRPGPIPLGDLQTLRARLTALQAAGASLDADGDGQGDYAELAASSDPNSADANASLCGIEGPRYGCGARVAAAPVPDASAWPWVAAAIAVSVALRRRTAS